MASPFPGMDPFIEDQIWLTFHADLAVETKRFLVGQLAGKYYPFTVRYKVVEYFEELVISASSLIPDVGITPDPNPEQTPSLGLGTIVKAPVAMKVRMPAVIPHYRIEIRDTENRDLVTVIEFLSPTNKTGGGRKKYLQKRRRLLLSSVHLVEMDLLLQGKKLPMADPYPNGDYFILCGRADSRPIFQVWPFFIDEPLPTIPVPLLEGDADAFLDLQEIYRKVIDLGGYDRILDYRKPLTMPLSMEQKNKIGKILGQKGLAV